MLPLPFWLLAAKQDYKTCEVSGYLCIIISILNLLYACLFTNLLSVIIILIFIYFTFRNKELPLFGQADFLILGSWLFSSFTPTSGDGLMLLHSFIFLFALIFYCAIYKDKDGNRWQRGKMIPMLPPYAVSLALIAIVRYPISIYFSTVGW